MIDIRSQNPQSDIPMETLLSNAPPILDSIFSLNREIAKSLVITFIQDLDGIGIISSMDGASHETSRHAWPNSWNIAAYVQTLGTRSRLFDVAVQAKSSVKINTDVLPPSAECAACRGLGSMRAFITSETPDTADPLGPHKINSDQINNVLPREIIHAHQALSRKIDWFRGNGKFDSELRHIECRLLSIKRFLFNYRISIEAKTEAGDETLQAQIGLIHLAPLLYVGENHIPASSRWEAEQISNAPVPTEVSYFKACPSCKGLGY